MNFLESFTKILLRNIGILIVVFFLSCVWGFIRYKNKENMDRNEIYSHIRDGRTLEEALRMAFSNLNKHQNLALLGIQQLLVGSEIAS